MIGQPEDESATTASQVGQTHQDRVATGYYIYGLIDPQAFRETGGDVLLSIFYVGKGRAARWAAHERDVLADLAREELRLERRSSKAERIRMILDRGEHVSAVRLSAGYVDGDDAYYAESLAIDTIGAVLQAAGRPPLTNAVPGHHAGFIHLRDHFIFTETEERVIAADDDLTTEEAAADGEGARPQEILVKGTIDDTTVPAQRLGSADQLPAEVAQYDARVSCIEVFDVEPSAASTRRGWDPLDPWTDIEARERARRYWPIAAHRVAAWLADADTMPRAVLLGIPDGGGRTVVRYAWAIDPVGMWEYYPNSQRWGLPLGGRLYEHPRLGAALFERRGTKRVQVLQGYASGFRLIDA